MHNRFQSINEPSDHRRMRTKLPADFNLHQMKNEDFSLFFFFVKCLILCFKPIMITLLQWFIDLRLQLKTKAKRFDGLIEEKKKNKIKLNPSNQIQSDYGSVALVYYLHFFCCCCRSKYIWCIENSQMINSKHFEMAVSGNSNAIYFTVLSCASTFFL